jgi:hypothetical protein
MVGRTAEAVHLSYDTLYWCPNHGTAGAEVYMSKSGKIKTSYLAAGKTRHECFYKQIGDLMATDGHDVCDGTQGAWVVPSLLALKNPNSKLGDFITDLYPPDKKGKQRYAHVALEDMVEGASAVGIIPKP